MRTVSTQSRSEGGSALVFAIFAVVAFTALAAATFHGSAMMSMRAGKSVEGSRTLAEIQGTTDVILQAVGSEVTNNQDFTGADTLTSLNATYPSGLYPGWEFSVDLLDLSGTPQPIQLTDILLTPNASVLPGAAQGYAWDPLRDTYATQRDAKIDVVKTAAVSANLLPGQFYGAGRRFVVGIRDMPVSMFDVLDLTGGDVIVPSTYPVDEIGRVGVVGDFGSAVNIRLNEPPIIGGKLIGGTTVITRADDQNLPRAADNAEQMQAIANDALGTSLGWLSVRPDTLVRPRSSLSDLITFISGVPGLVQLVVSEAPGSDDPVLSGPAAAAMAGRVTYDTTSFPIPVIFVDIGGVSYPGAPLVIVVTDSRAPVLFRSNGYNSTAPFAVILHPSSSGRLIIASPTTANNGVYMSPSIQVYAMAANAGYELNGTVITSKFDDTSAFAPIGTWGPLAGVVTYYNMYGSVTLWDAVSGNHPGGGVTGLIYNPYRNNNASLRNGSLLPGFAPVATDVRLMGMEPIQFQATPDQVF